MPFLLPNQQRQSTEEPRNENIYHSKAICTSKIIVIMIKIKNNQGTKNKHKMSQTPTYWPLLQGKLGKPVLGFLKKQERWWDGSYISWTICKSFAPCSRQIIVPSHQWFSDHFNFLYILQKVLQWFDAVGSVAGRASGLHKTEWWGAGIFICLKRGENDLHMVQLMPLPHHHLLLL